MNDDKKKCIALTENSKSMESVSLTVNSKMVESVGLMKSLVDDCANPTQEELRKLLAMQGAFLNQIGVSLMEEAVNSKKKFQKISLGLKALAASRAAIDSASRIETKEEVKDDHKQS